eukprot:715380-Ditylum_brightwellii.AAC.1
MVSSLPAISWYLQTQRDTSCSDVVAKPKGCCQTTCEILQALPIWKTAQAEVQSRTSKNIQSSAMAK